MTSQAKPDPSRLSLEERIDRATKILGTKCDKASVKAAVWRIWSIEERQKKRLYINKGKPSNKREKKAVDRLEKALHRLNMALNDVALPTGIAKAFDRQGMLALQKHLKDLATRKLDKPKRPPNVGKDWAAQGAGSLLQKHGIPVERTRGKKKLHRLAAVLYGDESTDMYQYCRRYYNVDFLDTSE
jgi:hypothetical protein